MTSRRLPREASPCAATAGKVFLLARECSSVTTGAGGSSVARARLRFDHAGHPKSIRLLMTMKRRIDAPWCKCAGHSKSIHPMKETTTKKKVDTLYHGASALHVRGADLGRQLAQLSIASHRIASHRIG